MTDDRPTKDTLSIRRGSDNAVTGGPPAQTAGGTLPLREIGPYKLLEVLGEGGMGTVYLAEQTKPIHRRVALKIIKLGMDTKQVVARFETEREALALMNHPNVAKVLDAGATETGRPYFVMEYVAGIPITEYSDKHRLTTVERLLLFKDVCNAIQHAHQKGIIHRDIKPSNVLVSVQDERPMPKVIDFGVAKATQHRLTERTLYTDQGQLIGTPGYMSPEQAEMTALDIDTRTDVYSLGVLLYELLVGAMPFDTKTLLQAGFAEIQRIIREVDPPKPSTRLSALRSEPRVSTSGSEASADQSVERKRHDHPQPHGRRVRSSIDDIARRRHTEPKTLIRQIRGDLDWIVMRAMEKDRTRRYDTANGLALEIQRYLKNEPVLAGPPSTSYRLRKFVRRNSGLVAGVSAVLLTLAVGLVGTGMMYARAKAAAENVRKERDRAVIAESLAAREAAESKRQAEVARQVTEFLVGVFKVSDPTESNGDTITARTILDRGQQRIDRELHDQPRVRAKLLKALGTVYYGLGLYSSAERLLREALTVFQREPDVDTAEFAATMEVLVYVFAAQGRYEEGEQLGRRQVDVLRGAFGPDDPRTVLAETNLTQFLYRRYDPQGAERTAMEATLLFILTVLDTVIDPKGYDPEGGAAIAEIRRIQSNEGHDAALRFVTRYWRGRLDMIREHGRAERYDAATAEIRRHYAPLLTNVIFKSQVVPTLDAISEYLSDRGDFLAAECFSREALHLARTVKGEEHILTAICMGNLSGVLQQRGYYREAERMMREAIARCRGSMEADHPNVIRGTHNLAVILAELGDYDQAEHLLREVSSRYEARNESEDIFAARNLTDLGRVLSDTGDDAEAEPLLRKAIEVLGKKEGKDGIRLASGLHALADVLVHRGEFNEAERLYRDSLVIRRQRLGDAHPNVAESLFGLAGVRCRKNAHQEAEQDAREALSICEESLRLDNSPAPQVRRLFALRALGNALAGLRRFAEAEQVFLESCDQLSVQTSVSPRKRRDILIDTARFYESWDAAEPGKGYAEKAAEWRAKLEQVQATKRRSDEATKGKDE